MDKKKTVQFPSLSDQTLKAIGNAAEGCKKAASLPSWGCQEATSLTAEIEKQHIVLISLLPWQVIPVGKQVEGAAMQQNDALCQGEFGSEMRL